MALVRLAANLQKCVQKCATCERWNGPRQRSVDGLDVEFDAEQARGECVGGPWDGTLRDPLTRCGHWIMWVTPR